MSKKTEKLNTSPSQLELPFPKPSTFNLRAGSCRTKEAILEAFKCALKKCPLERDQVAAEVERLTGETFSVHTLNNILAQGKENRRFPLELVKALTMITGDLNILKAALQPEFDVLDRQEKAAFEYGRMILEDKARSKKKRELEQAAGSYMR